jgi:CheY-like chemotaxis protein
LDDQTRVFLAYASENREQVEHLYQVLSEAGLKPWMDVKDILPGEKWKISIRTAIQDADFFLACLSMHSVGKRGFLQQEIRDALDLWKEQLDSDIYLIPIRLDDCEVPEPLHDLQHLDLFALGAEKELLKAIQVGTERRQGSNARTPKPDPGSKESVRVVCADDSDIARQGLINILDAQPDIRVVSSVGELDSVTDAVVKHRAQLLLLDLKWGRDFRAGLDLIPTVKQAAPDCKILALTAYEGLALEAVVAGVDAAVEKGIPRTELVFKIRILVQETPSEQPQEDN